MPQIDASPLVDITPLFDVLEAIDISTNSDEFKQLVIRLAQQVNNQAIRLNEKDHGILSLESYGCCKQIFPEIVGGNLRGIARTMIDFGALPNAATKVVAHNITTNADTRWTYIYAVATNSLNQDGVPIPFADAGGVTGNIQLRVTNTFVEIQTTTNWTAYDKTYVYLEYTT